MAHYAFLDDNNIVTEVIVGRDEDDLANGVSSWEDYYGSFRSQRCLQTSYNTYGGVHYTNGKPSKEQSKTFRKNYAGIGYTYDEERDAFIPPQPYESWTLNEDSCLWESPVPYPADGGLYVWDEDSLAWVEAPDEAV
jgi:hypothetical protein